MAEKWVTGRNVRTQTIWTKSMYMHRVFWRDILDTQNKRRPRNWQPRSRVPISFPFSLKKRGWRGGLCLISGWKDFFFFFFFLFFVWRNSVSAMIDKVRNKTWSTLLKEFLDWWIYDSDLSTRISRVFENGLSNFNSIYKHTETTERNQH